MRPLSIYSAQKFNKNRFFKKRLALHRFILLSKYDVWSLRRKKFQMGYKIRTSEVQIFVRCKRSKWGTVPPNGVRLATLIPMNGLILLSILVFISSFWLFSDLIIVFLFSFETNRSIFSGCWHIFIIWISPYHSLAIGFSQLGSICYLGRSFSRWIHS